MLVTGIPSGDHECWCLLVTEEDFKRIKGEAPDKEFDVGPFAKDGSPYRYRLYPSDLIQGESGKVTTIYIDSGIQIPTQKKG